MNIWKTCGVQKGDKEASRQEKSEFLTPSGDSKRSEVLLWSHVEKSCQGSNFLELEGEKTPPSKVSAERKGHVGRLDIRKHLIIWFSFR